MRALLSIEANKHDGLNSPILRGTLGFSKWPRIVAIQAVMRFPLNLRPFLLISKTYNPKGLALFVLALLDRFRVSKDSRHLQEAERLLETLQTLRSPGQYSGSCWGYPYPWQDPGFFAPAHTPNAVVTCFVCEALLEAHRVTGKQTYLDSVASAAKFLVNDLTILKDEADELCVSYMPMPMTMRVMDVSILIASVLAQLAALGAGAGYQETAFRLINYVIARQTAEGAWFYTDPPGDSHITHDNYHTGFILDAIDRYRRATGDSRYDDNYWRGLEFYATRLFEADGAPRWMSDKRYPHDIHGAAQGILTFARHNSDRYPGFAQRVYDWTMNNMYHDSGRFYYQKNRYYTRSFTLLRWCNAWMARAMAALQKELTTHNEV